MKQHKLGLVARALVAAGKGIPAADEGFPTIANEAGVMRNGKPCRPSFELLFQKKHDLQSYSGRVIGPFPAGGRESQCLLARGAGSRLKEFRCRILKDIVMR